jgi:hypothetical protein
MPFQSHFPFNIHICQLALFPFWDQLFQNENWYSIISQNFLVINKFSANCPPMTN